MQGHRLGEFPAAIAAESILAQLRCGERRVERSAYDHGPNFDRNDFDHGDDCVEGHAGHNSDGHWKSCLWAARARALWRKCRGTRSTEQGALRYSFPSGPTRRLSARSGSRWPFPAWPHGLVQGGALKCVVAPLRRSSLARPHKQTVSSPRGGEVCSCHRRAPPLSELDECDGGLGRHLVEGVRSSVFAQQFEAGSVHDGHGGPLFTRVRSSAALSTLSLP